MTMKHAIMMLAAPAALAAAPAEAAIFSFDLTGDYSAAFGLDSDLLAPPAESSAGSFLVENVAGVFGGVAQTARSIEFNTGGAGTTGGFTIELDDGDFRSFFGPQLFTGTTALPTLRTGTFALKPDTGGSATLSVAAAAVPEPASWAMMIAGFGMVGAAMRRRTKVRATIRFA